MMIVTQKKKKRKSGLVLQRKMVLQIGFLFVVCKYSAPCKKGMKRFIAFNVLILKKNQTFLGGHLVGLKTMKLLD